MKIISKIQTNNGTAYQCFLSRTELDTLLFGKSKNKAEQSNDLFEKLARGHTELEVELFEHIGQLIDYVQYPEFTHAINQLQRMLDRLKDVGTAVHADVDQILAFGTRGTCDREI